MEIKLASTYIVRSVVMIRNNLNHLAVCDSWWERLKWFHSCKTYNNARPISGLKQCTLFHKLKVKVSTVLCFFWGSRGESASRGRPHSSQLVSCLSHLLWTRLPCFLLTQLSSGQSPHPKIFSSVTSAKSLLPSKVTYYQVPGMRVWASLGKSYSV